MSTTRPLEEGLDPETDEPATGLGAGRPRLPVSRPPRQPTTAPEGDTRTPPSPSSPEDPRRPPSTTDRDPSIPPRGPGDDRGSTGPSSTGSTDRARDQPRSVPRAAPEDVKAALVQGADMVFVLAGQGIGVLHDRARRQANPQAVVEHEQQRWVPTPAERALVLAPASRIIARHLPDTDLASADAIDAALIAAGLAAFSTRSMFGIDALAQTPGPPSGATVAQ